MARLILQGMPMICAWLEFEVLGAVLPNGYLGFNIRCATCFGFHLLEEF